MRFFIALEIPEENKQQLKLIQQKLLEILPGIKLSDPSKLHLTLAFVGEQPENLVVPLSRVIQDTASNESSFEVIPAYIDGFPHLHSAKVLWVGVKGDIDKLMIIRHKIKDGLVDLKLNVDERRFIPHIALAKANMLKITKFEEEKIEKFMQGLELAPIRVSSLKLFESIPNLGFHQHNTLAEVPLKP